MRTNCPHCQTQDRLCAVLTARVTELEAEVSTLRASLHAYQSHCGRVQAEVERLQAIKGRGPYLVRKERPEIARRAREARNEIKQIPKERGINRDASAGPGYAEQ